MHVEDSKLGAAKNEDTCNVFCVLAALQLAVAFPGAASFAQYARRHGLVAGSKLLLYHDVPTTGARHAPRVPLAARSGSTMRTSRLPQHRLPRSPFRSVATDPLYSGPHAKLAQSEPSELQLYATMHGKFSEPSNDDTFPEHTLRLA